MRIRIPRRRALLIAAVAACLVPAFSVAAPASDGITVFAAASMTNAITELGNIFSGRVAAKVTSSFAASSALAKQIERGAPANVFISADEAWLNYLEGKRLTVPGSRFILAGNRMVLVAPSESKIEVCIGPLFPLARLLGDGRLATGDPDHVPVGMYARACLEKLGVWKDIDPRLARANDVRGALALVERGECPLGIVYSTDASISRRVKVVAAFPEDCHPPINYCAALVSGRDTPAAQNFLEFLKTRDAKSVLEKYGFTVR